MRRDAHEILRRYGRRGRNQGAGRDRPARRRHHQSLAGGQGRARLQGDHRRDLRRRAGPGHRRGRRDRLEGMLKEGRVLAKIAKNVTVKVPLTWTASRPAGR